MSVHKVIVEVERGDRSVVEYELGEFDHTLLWECRTLAANSLRNVELRLNRGAKVPDLIENPLSWMICSQRLVDYLSPILQGSVQFLDCSINDDAGNAVSGWRVMNVLDQVEAINTTLSDCEMEDGEIEMVNSWVFDLRKLPARESLFREKLFPYAVFVTDRTARNMPEFTGLVFLECDVV